MGPARIRTRDGEDVQIVDTPERLRFEAIVDGRLAASPSRRRDPRAGPEASYSRRAPGASAWMPCLP
jgi:hypothetical protein